MKQSSQLLLLLLLIDINSARNIDMLLCYWRRCFRKKENLNHSAIQKLLALEVTQRRKRLLRTHN
jgi:hypothetical protein